LQDDVQVVVGERIAALRKSMGLTQDQLAERAGVNRVHLYRLETGRQSMTLRTLQIIAEALDVKISDIVAGL
jgi:transcriptional regulator with XRE-family HTH domain